MSYHPAIVTRRKLLDAEPPRILTVVQGSFGQPVMPTVLQINSVCGNGSTGRIALSLHKALLESGEAAWIAYGRGEGPSVPNKVKVGNPSSVIAHGALTRLFDRHGLGSRSATISFIRRIESLAPDVIHLHNIHGYYLNFEVLFEYLTTARIPVVWTLHDCWAFTGHCAYYDYVKCTRWRAQCGRCPQRSGYPASWFLDASTEILERKKRAFTSVGPMTLVTPSAWLAGEIRSSFLSKYPLEVIPNGIDTSLFAPSSSAAATRARLGIPRDADIILGVAADFGEPRKGLGFFLEIAPRLGSGSVIVLVGVPRARMAGLPANVIGIRRTDDIRGLVELYSTASVFVNPTLEDNFPTVVLEALACGTPVVTFGAGGCPEQVSGERGAVVKTGDIEGLLVAIESVLRSGKNVYTSACRAYAARFSLESMFGEYMRVYAASAKLLRTK